MITPPLPHSVSRRTMLKLAAATVASSGTLLLPPTHQNSTLASTTTPASAPDEPSAPRFRFDCISPVAAVPPLTRLEEVWASPLYLTFTGCTVRYIGAGPFLLTAEESAIVDVVARGRGDNGDRRGTYLQVLRASTRIDPARFEQRLNELGPPIVAGSVARAPEAPQAHLLTKWLAAKEQVG